LINSKNIRGIASRKILPGLIKNSVDVEVLLRFSSLLRYIKSFKVINVKIENLKIYKLYSL
jgi:hypothetical protein